MQPYVQITTTTGDHAVAEKIAVELVDHRLVACAQISGPVRSVYRWQGKVEFAEEFVVHMKTTGEHIESVKRVITELHPYDVPEIIVVPIVDGSREYLLWLDEETRPGDE
ncbi:Divalent-cation tolerance protein CutA [Aeoliella mucimassa]|uniref:Divalent-cation tolerance protein CutA n=2 Tax=Aeoliella mucimassa TaxID=2527972 RepID=A0A518ATU1_9BACT|nr:Divalent-cation tolerance protein CutA [Aeoliella mucimassa]